MRKPWKMHSAMIDIGPLSVLRLRFGVASRTCTEQKFNQGTCTCGMEIEFHRFNT